MNIRVKATARRREEIDVDKLVLAFLGLIQRMTEDEKAAATAHAEARRSKQEESAA